MNAVSIIEAPATELAKIVAPLDPNKAAIVRDGFGRMFAALDAWTKQAASIVVTSEDQKGTMRTARALRLEIRAARLELEAKRKVMKKAVIDEGKAIDGAYKIFESLSDPLETYLLEQERFGERAEAARRDAVRSARAEALLALNVADAAMPGSLGDMSEETWETVLEGAKAARDARVEQARLAKEAEVEAARIVAEREAHRKAEAAKAEAERRARAEEQRIENERLKAEAVAREAEAKAERERLAAEAAKERAALEAKHAAEKALRDAEDAEREKAHAEELATAEAQRVKEAARMAAYHAEAAERSRLAKVEAEKAALELASAQAKAADLQRQDDARKATEAEQKKPTKAKYTALLTALNEIAQWERGGLEAFADDEDMRAVTIARKALAAIGEAP